MPEPFQLSAPPFDLAPEDLANERSGLERAWNQAMAEYQARRKNPRWSGATTADQPEQLDAELLAPLRTEARSLFPGYTNQLLREEVQQSLIPRREAATEHLKNLEAQNEFERKMARYKLEQKANEDFQKEAIKSHERSQLQSAKGTKTFPTKTDLESVAAFNELAPQFKSKYGFDAPAGLITNAPPVVSEDYIPSMRTGLSSFAPAPMTHSSPNMVLRQTNDGRTAYFDADTKQFLRYAD